MGGQHLRQGWHNTGVAFYQWMRCSFHLGSFKLQLCLFWTVGMSVEVSTRVNVRAPCHGSSELKWGQQFQVQNPDTWLSLHRMEVVHFLLHNLFPEYRIALFAVLFFPFSTRCWSCFNTTMTPQLARLTGIAVLHLRWKRSPLLLWSGVVNNCVLPFLWESKQAIGSPCSAAGRLSESL